MLQVINTGSFVGFDIVVYFSFSDASVKSFQEEVNAYSKGLLGSEYVMSVGVIESKLKNLYNSLRRYFTLLLNDIAEYFRNAVADEVFSVANTQSVDMNGYVWKALDKRYVERKTKLGVMYQKEYARGLKHSFIVDVIPGSIHKVILRCGFEVDSIEEADKILANEFGSVHQPARPILEPMHDALYRGISTDLIPRISDLTKYSDFKDAFRTILSEKPYKNWW
jgi:hypothetical protein